MTTQPAVRWIPTGEHAGIYIWIPTFRNWRHTKLVPGGIEDRTVENLPLGSTPLIALTDIGEAIDLYRDQLDACTCPDSEQHADAKTTVLTEVSDAADLALYELAPGEVSSCEPVWKESPLTMQDLRRRYDG